ncbi:MAG: MBL fold metallo-hydrolase [Candidatus Methanomethylophilus sp.]|jgi:glyoxylase-like metal-dependent hydrolase (beta-lactamase superfamily II)|nr:MBL fold metallo-hydrolase [Methanomethylophilus sp.]MCI2075072.1 MBL fold metallo-hydrolase [Methanomethylophilus sp.]MCI2092414.1 MBL fold metallo-hydrolase [Methanomethylophilus sp.]
MSEKGSSVAVVMEGHLERGPEGEVVPERTWSTCTLVRTGGRSVLVDTGSSFTVRELEKGLEAAGISADEVDTVVLTHHHPDHVGGIGLFPDAEIVMAQGPGVPGRDVHFITEDTEILPGVSLVMTPGHTWDSASLFMSSSGDGLKYVIAGDAVPKRSNLEKRKVPALNVSREEAMRSMERIVRWADIVVPGHEAPFRTDGLKRLY